jgi:hypothetical protein
VKDRQPTQAGHRCGDSLLRHEYKIAIPHVFQVTIPQIRQSNSALDLLETKNIRASRGARLDGSSQGGQFPVIRLGVPIFPPILGVFPVVASIIEEILNVVGNNNELPAAGQERY